ncbi:SsgA family sporulation/cell division regulator [Streptomyces sp. NBC_00564]|uniref:SsgA family sporulation/cell division regulator n=1 Tax=unclassified Streptomyces TaxID=2593676 RepID=UPI002FCDAE16|nr:SsgA family sporulation/cell division regulator [Streptomyces sp. NBC_00564]
MNFWDDSTTMDNFAATEDDDFDALLNASSLGAPHVLAETAPIPDHVHRRLAQAAAHPAQPPTGMQTAATPDNEDCATDSGADQDPEPDSQLERVLRSYRIVTLAGAPGTGRSTSALRLLYEINETTPHPASDWFTDVSDCDRYLALAVTVCHGLPYGAVYEAAQALHAAVQDRERTTHQIQPTASRPSALPRSEQLRSGPEIASRSALDAYPHTPLLRAARLTELLAPAHLNLPPRTRMGTAFTPALFDSLTPLTPLTSHPQATRSPFLVMPAPLGQGAPQRTPSWFLGPVDGVRTAHTHDSWPDHRAHDTGPFHLLPGLAALLTHCRETEHRREAVHTERSRVFQEPHSLLPPWHLFAGRAPHIPDKPHLAVSVGIRTTAQSAENTGSASPHPALRMWTETTQECTIQHAYLRMRVHHTEADHGYALPARFTYRISDPYAVEAVFYENQPEEKVWTFARDLLFEGLDHSAGEGDVIVWPSPEQNPDDQRIFIRLHSPEGTALLSTPRAQLKQYLDATQHLVACGAEHRRLDGSLDSFESALGQLISTDDLNDQPRHRQPPGQTGLPKGLKAWELR